MFLHPMCPALEHPALKRRPDEDNCQVKLMGVLVHLYIFISFGVNLKLSIIVMNLSLFNDIIFIGVFHSLFFAFMLLL